MKIFIIKSDYCVKDYIIQNLFKFIEDINGTNNK